MSMSTNEAMESIGGGLLGIVGTIVGAALMLYTAGPTAASIFFLGGPLAGIVSVVAGIIGGGMLLVLLLGSLVTVLSGVWALGANAAAWRRAPPSKVLPSNQQFEDFERGS